MATAIITGGSKGLGRALTRALHALGWHVVFDGRDAAAVAALARELGRDAVGLGGDVTDPVHRADLIAAAAAAGDVRLLVNNASTIGPSPMPAVADYPLDAWRDVYETNVVAPMALTQAVLPLLSGSVKGDGPEPGGSVKGEHREPGGSGTVVNITSDAGVEAYEGWGAYGSSKAALEQWGNVLAVERPDLSIYTVDPGDMRTDLHQAAFPGEDISDRPPPEVSVPGLLALILGALPSGRYVARKVATVPEGVSA